MFRNLTRRGFLRLSSIVTSSALTSGVIAACAAPPPPAASKQGDAAKPTAAQATAPAAPTQSTVAQPTAAQAAQAAQPTAATQAAPVAVPAAQQVTLKFQSAFGTTDIFHQMGADYIKKVEEMSGGRVKIDFLPNGSIVPFAQIIDAVHQGLLDGGVAVPAYWFGKNKATSLFGTGPSFGLDADGVIGWMMYGGGNDLYAQLIQETLRLNVVSFFGPPMPTQPLGWFKNEIRSADDLKGLKFRTVGLSADLFTELGAAVTILAGPDIVPALERGVIDGAEFNNPSSDKLLGFQDVVKYLMVQSYHQPVEFLEYVISKPKYDAMPADLKAIFRYAAMAQSADSTWKYFLDQNSKDLAEIKSRGVNVIKTPKSVLEAQLRAWDVIVDRESKADPFFARVVQSQKDWAARVVPLRQEIMVENETAFQHYFRR